MVRAAGLGAAAAASGVEAAAPAVERGVGG